MPGVLATASLVTTSGAGIGPVLVRLAAGSPALVVGARGHGAVGGALMGSISQYATRHATCPVVVARAVEDLRAGRVVAGVDESPVAGVVLEQAFTHADAHGLALTVLHAWQPPTAGYRALALQPSAGLGGQLADATHVLSDRLDAWTSKYPDVVVTPAVRVGRAASALVEESAHATLVVVGTRDRSGPAALLGSVGHAVLHGARCPVLVAR